MNPPADVPPRLNKLLVRLVAGSFTLATAALALAGYCFTMHGGTAQVAGAIGTGAMSVGLALKVALS